MRPIRYLAFAGLVFASLSVSSGDEATKVVTVGKPAPDITLTGLDGKPFKLSDSASRGKNVALMFSRAHW